MAKASVYLRDDLLDEARQLDLPVSSVCQRAVEEAVRLGRAMAEARTDLLRVANRLSQSGTTEPDLRFEDGYELGAQWARDYALLAELEDLAQTVNSGAPVIQLSADHSLPVFLAGHFWDADVAADAFVRLGERPFDRGVLTGAAEVYVAVRPYLVAQIDKRGS